MSRRLPVIIPMLALAWLCLTGGALAQAPAPSPAGDSAAKLASQRGFRATLEARDRVANRSFTATVVYAYPDRALATISKDEFVWVGGGAVVLREGDALRRSDVSGWLRAIAAGLAKPVAELAGIVPEGAAPPDLAALSGRLGLSLALDLRRRDDRVSIALLLSHRYDAASSAAPGLGFTATEGLDVVASPATGFPERVWLATLTGRLEAEVVVTAFETLAAVPEALLALPAGVDLAKAEAVEPSARLKERVADDVLRCVLGRLRAAGARDASLLERAGPRIDGALTGAYVALFHAAYGEARLREEARRAVSAEADFVRATLAEAGEARRKAALDALRGRFAQNCRRQLRDALGELVRIAEAALAPGGDKADEAARRRLIGMSGGAAREAFERAVVAPMEAEAAAEIARLAGEPFDRASAGSPGGSATRNRQGESRP